MLVHILPYGILSNHFLPPKRQSSPRRSRLMRAAFCFCRSPDAHLTQRSRGHEHTFVNSSPWFTVLTLAYKATRFVVISSLPLSVITPAPISRILQPLGETPSETVLDDQGAAKPQSVRLDVLLDPLFASGSERAEQENCALIANQNVRGIWNNLRRIAHGCVLLSSNTHQVTKIEKAPSLSGAVVETVCTLCHIRLSGLPPCVPKRRLVALSRCPDAGLDSTCVGPQVE